MSPTVLTKKMQTSFIGKWEVRGSIRNFHEEIKGFALGILSLKYRQDF